MLAFIYSVKVVFFAACYNVAGRRGLLLAGEMGSPKSRVAVWSDRVCH